MAGGDTLGIGVSGLLAFQRALATVSHNISNANTDGYSRQRTELITQTPQFAGNGYVGTGVRVDSIKRLYDDFLALQARTSTSSFSRLDRYYNFASQVDGMLAGAQTGLAPALQDFFNAVQGVANDPASVPARQALLGMGGTLVDRFRYLDRQLADLYGRVNADLRDTVTEINNLASGIASLNQEIARAQGSGQTPNDLLDRRDNLINQLAKRVSVTTVAQSDGTVSVFAGNGQTLVVGTKSMSLSITPNLYDATRYDIGYAVGSTTVNVSSQLTGGTLGGALDFRSQVLDTARAALGRVAAGLAKTLNDQHRLGMDLNGAMGGSFFTAPTPTVAPASTNSGGSVGIAIGNASGLQASDYQLRYDGSNAYTLTRLSDGTTTAIATGGTSPYTTSVIDGFTLTITAGAATGDTFLVKPVTGSAGSIGLAVSDPNKIAAAAPIRTAATLTNTGTGAISAGTVSNTTNLPLAATITLTFDATNNRFNVTNGPGGTIDYNPSTDSGGKEFTFSGYGGMKFTISGVPANGDTFTIASNAGGTGDNRNALLLGALQTQSTLAGGTATYAGAYGQLVSDVGTKTRAAEINRGAQAALRDQALAARAAVSGVNLDEEAADMVRFQQAYQAAAQVITVSNTLFETLLGAVRR
jgi:flagellar hook-associated protein 1 FlgK